MFHLQTTSQLLMTGMGNGHKQNFPSGGGGPGGGGLWGDTPPSGDPELLEAPNKFFGVNTCAEGRQRKCLIGRRPGENCAQSLKGGEGGGRCQTPPCPREMLSCLAKLWTQGIHQRVGMQPVVNICLCERGVCRTSAPPPS